MCNASCPLGEKGPTGSPVHVNTPRLATTGSQRVVGISSPTPCSPISGEETLPPYVDILRGKNVRGKNKDRSEWVTPVVQIHGSVKNPSTIVLSREGYRRLLHTAPNYQHFLKSLMLSRTILYIGFSFTDDYLNEVCPSP